jgi:hypothetical protein
MSVISCNEISQNRSIEYHANTSRTYRRVFRVECSSPYDGPLAVIQANGIPAQYSTYATATESDAFALCTEVQAKTEGDGMKTWLVEATYSTSAIPKNQDPLQDPVRYKIGFDQFTKVARQDVNGAPVSNSMGDTFIPPVVVDDSRVIYTITRNEPQLNLPFWADMKDSVNISPWGGMDVRCVKCKSITVSENQVRNGTAFYAVTYEFALNADSWDFKILNQGFKYKQNFTPGDAVMTKAQGDPVTMDINNSYLVDMQKNPNTDPATIYLTKRLYKERDFSLFNF